MKKTSHQKLPKAPRELGAHGGALWKAIQEEYAITDPGGLTLLQSACRSEDDIQAMRKLVAEQGACIQDRFGQQREHPLLGAIRGSEQTKRQALRSLNLDLEPLHDRPGRPGGT